ncbi:MAG: nucleoside hydrolase [Verrucomicrobiaceae bacterium]|nr:MAG: nucleoside hydrolase [Verrucomicrobiaceae bacterium]
MENGPVINRKETCARHPNSAADRRRDPRSHPVSVVLDTDMGNDIDDALALVMLHSLQDAGECEILGVALSKDSPWAAVYTGLLNRFCGRPQIPLGAVRDGPTKDEGKFIRQIAETLGAGHSTKEPEDAVVLLRRLLASCEDQSVVVITIGFLTNLSRLMDSPPDDISPMDGMELFSRKVQHVCSMAGCFRPGKTIGGDSGNPEYNIRTDISAARNFFHRFPGTVTFSGFEVGASILFPGDFIEKALEENPCDPVASAYASFLPMPYDRPSWDQSVVLHAVRPDHAYFDVSEPGRVNVAPDGRTSFIPDGHGRHRYLILREEMIPVIIRDMLALCSMKLSAGSPPVASDASALQL